MVNVKSMVNVFKNLKEVQLPPDSNFRIRKTCKTLEELRRMFLFQTLSRIRLLITIDRNKVQALLYHGRLMAKMAKN